MRTLGWVTDFRPRPWPEIRSFLAEVAEQNIDFQYLVDIATSVIESGHQDELAACTSMHDIVVALRPVGEPPLEVVWIRAPDSIRRAPKPGHVRIEDQSLPGRDDDLQRPADEAVALFWRFMIEKFGVAPPPRG